MHGSGDQGLRLEIWVPVARGGMRVGWESGESFWRILESLIERKRERDGYWRGGSGVRVLMSKWHTEEMDIAFEDAGA